VPVIVPVGDGAPFTHATSPEKPFTPEANRVGFAKPAYATFQRGISVKDTAHLGFPPTRNKTLKTSETKRDTFDSRFFHGFRPPGCKPPDDGGFGLIDAGHWPGIRCTFRARRVTENIGGARQGSSSFRVGSGARAPLPLVGEQTEDGFGARA